MRHHLDDKGAVASPCGLQAGRHQAPTGVPTSTYVQVGGEGTLPRTLRLCSPVSAGTFVTLRCQGSFVVAYRRPHGEFCAVSDHLTGVSAQREARQRNAASLASSKGTNATRRPVRAFPQDHFA